MNNTENELQSNSVKSRPKGLYPLIVPDVPTVTEPPPEKEKPSYRARFFSRISNRESKKADEFEPTKPKKGPIPETFSRSKSVSDDRSNNSLINWVCPNDRQLMLRAKLRIGWSVKAELYEKYGCKPKPLSESEQEIISSVIKRAEALEKQEQERIGRLVERLDNMKKHSLGTGTKQCVLCGDKFGFLGSACMICHDCKKCVCTKCGIETTCAKQRETIWLCKICAETREMWKKSGAWFYKSMPKYVLPPKTDMFPMNYRMCERDPLWSNTMESGKEEEESSSEDDVRTTRSAPARYNLANSSVSPTSPGSTKNVPPSTASSSSLSSRMAKVTISERNRNKFPNDRVYLREESFESGSSRTQSSESGGSVPQIFVNYCDAESGFESNNRELSGSDKSSVSSGVIGHHANEEYPEEDSSVDSVPKVDSSMGTIELSIQYDPDANSLHISLHSAKKLKAMDINGHSDPFCKLNLLPVGAKSYRLRTRTVNKTVNPEFNETLTFYGITDNDILTQSLHILILDDDKYGHDFLGEAKFPLHKLKPRVTRDLCLNLEKHIPGDLEDEVWGEGCGSNGQIALTLLYSTRKRALIVGVVRCFNLIPMDSNGYSDPFVKLWLKSPEGSSPKYKTSIKWKNLNPVYNEEFIIDTKITDLSRKSLIITVWDKDPGRSNDYLGSLELGCHSKGERLRQWIDMIKYPDHKHEGVHNLSEEVIRH
ncbi:rabphilin-3A isoform X2 [Planococcus citri]|uniref:rabphilin-3A isoform X2 n=1 Tax=Planococcus citri TaxID=170843 RepID=UPI0031F75DEF